MTLSRRTALKRKTPLKAKASGIAERKPRQRKCDNPACDVKFTPKIGQKVCCWQCGLAVADQPANQKKARMAIEQRERREIQVRKEKVKRRSEYMSEAQAVINRYVRLRDAHLGCVSCERSATWQGQWHASHYRSRGAAPHLRFNLHNIHKACSICNNHLSGNIMGYRPELVRRIGEERVAMLEANQERAGFTIDYLKRLKRVFAEKARRLELRRAVA